MKQSIKLKRWLLVGLFLLYMPLAWSQQITGGVIRDVYGEPVPGANVVEKGTLNGTHTDANGRFSIQLENSRSTLEITFIGYLSQEVIPQANMEIILLEDTRVIEEVVVVGYGVTKRKDLTSSVTTLNVKDLNTICLITIKLMNATGYLEKV